RSGSIGTTSREAQQHLSTAPERDRTCHVDDTEAKIASMQELQQHLFNVRADGILVHHRHKIIQSRTSLPNIYGVQEVEGLNPVPRIGIWRPTVRCSAGGPISYPACGARERGRLHDSSARVFHPLGRGPTGTRWQTAQLVCAVAYYFLMKPPLRSPPGPQSG